MARKKRIRKLQPRVYFFIALLFAITFYALLIINRPKEEILEKKVEFHEEKMEIYIDEQVSAGYTIYRTDANDKLTWTTSNQNIASVDSNGIIKGISFGDVQITVTLENGASDTLNLRVKSYDVSLRVDVNNATLNNGWYNKNINVEILTTNVKYIKYCITKSESCVPTDNYQKPITLKKGIWNLYLEGIDNNNKPINHNETFKIDVDAPNCRITTVGKLNEERAVVSVSCVPDDSKILKFDWYRDNKLVYTTDQSEILMSEIIEEGNHKYKVMVSDSALNTKTYNVTN